MKKIIALIMSLVLCLTIGSVFAEKAEETAESLMEQAMTLSEAGDDRGGALSDR